MQFAFVVEFKLPLHRRHFVLIFRIDDMPQHTYLHCSCVFALLLKPLSLFDMNKFRIMKQLGIYYPCSLWSSSYSHIDMPHYHWFAFGGRVRSTAVLFNIMHNNPPMMYQLSYWSIDPSQKQHLASSIDTGKYIVHINITLIYYCQFTFSH
jgi:hypothetical protein